MRAQCLSPLHCPRTHVQAQTLVVRVLVSAEAAMAAAAVTMPVQHAEPGPFAAAAAAVVRYQSGSGGSEQTGWARWGLETDRRMLLQGVGVKKLYRSG